MKVYSIISQHRRKYSVSYIIFSLKELPKYYLNQKFYILHTKGEGKESDTRGDFCNESNAKFIKENYVEECVL